jgi:alkanesulfonate monooxygenase SsuD/methylene tetrahydromethanopterin reductase-like flavin-dependent oxidoreductase (luciferase family)
MAKKSLTFSRELTGDNIDDIVADGVEADRLGFDIAWVPDHLVDIRPPQAITDAWTTLAFIGAKTQKIRLGSGVTDIQRMHPAKIANVVATLDSLTNGRAILGIGTGEIMNTRPFGIPWEEKKIRIKRLREIIKVVKLLWSSSYEKPVSFTGDFYSLSNAHLSLSPVQKPGPPVFIGAFSSKGMLRLTGELAEGWYPGSQNTPEAFREKVELIREEAAKAGRSPNDVDMLASVPTIICTDDAQRAGLLVEIKRSLKTTLIQCQHMLPVIGIDEKDLEGFLPKELDYQLATPGPAFDEALAQAVETLSISDELLEKAIERLIAFGSVDDCLSLIEKFIQAGATQIFFANFVASRENYRRIAKEIIPRLSNS